jgi:hypothetical protein
VTPAGTEAVDVAGTQVQARHLTVQIAGDAPRHVWVDEQGRVLRVEIPAADLTAVRKAAP